VKIKFQAEHPDEEPARGLMDRFGAVGTADAGVAAVAAPTEPAARPEPRQQHLARDHRYVLHEIRRIAMIGGLIIAGLVLTAILR